MCIIFILDSVRPSPDSNIMLIRIVNGPKRNEQPLTCWVCFHSTLESLGCSKWLGMDLPLKEPDTHLGALGVSRSSFGAVFGSRPAVSVETAAVSFGLSPAICTKHLYPTHLQSVMTLWLSIRAP